MMCRCGIWQNKTFSIDLIYDMFICVCLFLYDLYMGLSERWLPIAIFLRSTGYGLLSKTWRAGRFLTLIRFLAMSL